MPDYTTMRKQLIGLYANRPIADLEKDGAAFTAATGLTQEQLMASDIFKDLNQRIKEQKEDLELCEERYKERTKSQALADPKAQVTESLKLLLNKALFNTAADTIYKSQMDVLSDLVRERYAGGWDENFKAHFEFLAPRIRDWYLFFFSYTNEGAALINNQYRATINSMIIDKRLDLRRGAQWQESNLLAELIIQHLHRNNVVRGFYDKVEIKIGEELDEITRTACGKSFLFIQLVTKDALAFRGQNWPFKEYEAFGKANKAVLKETAAYEKVLAKRFLFAIGGGSLADVTPKGLRPMDYEGWYAHIGLAHHKAPPNDREIFQKMVDDIAARVTEFVEKEWIQAV